MAGPPRRSSALPTTVGAAGRLLLAVSGVAAVRLPARDGDRIGEADVGTAGCAGRNRNHDVGGSARRRLVEGT